MATQHGVLQALWGEVRPAVEARVGTAVRPYITLVNRHKPAEALALFQKTLSSPATSQREALLSLAHRALCGGLDTSDADADTLRAMIWERVIDQGTPQWANCRLLLDEPYVDRVWLLRGGRWVFYRWTGDAFVGTSLADVRTAVEGCRVSEAEAMLTVSVCSRSYINPKLSP